MGKLVYVGWKPEHVGLREFCSLLLGPTADALAAKGARGVTMLLADDAAVPDVRIARRDPTAVVSL